MLEKAFSWSLLSLLIFKSSSKLDSCITILLSQLITKKNSQWKCLIFISKSTTFSWITYLSLKISTSFICRQTTLKKYAVFCPQKTERIFMHFQGQLWQTEVCKKAIAGKNEVEREFLCIFANKIQNWKWIHPYATIIPALLKQSHRKTIQRLFWLPKFIDQSKCRLAGH